MNVSPIESDFSWRNHQWNSWLYLPPRRWAFEHMKATKIILFLRERGSCRAWREGDIIWDWLTSEQLWGFYLNLRLNLLSRPFVGFKIQNCNFISCRLWNLSEKDKTFMSRMMTRNSSEGAKNEISCVSDPHIYNWIGLITKNILTKTSSPCFLGFLRRHVTVMVVVVKLLYMRKNFPIPLARIWRALETWNTTGFYLLSLSHLLSHL